MHHQLHIEKRMWTHVVKSDTCDSFFESNIQSDESGLGEDLKEILLEAHEQDRLTCGIYQSGKLFEMNAENIMLCILPENSASSTDVILHIHLKLIEAFCWENEIRIIKVDSAEKLKILLESAGDHEDQILANRSNALDYSCILVEYPTGKCSPAEEKVLDFHKITFDMCPQPVIPLKV